MELKQYQEKTVDTLVKKYNAQRDGSKENYLIFKAPTGSGKTIMMAEFLKRIISNNDDRNTAFIWVAPRDLHNQSKAKIERYLKNFPYRIVDKDNITAEPFAANDLFFFNWEKGITKRNGVWNNILVRENETERNLQDIMQKTRDENRHIVLIVDEGHQNYYAPRTQEFINEIIQPDTTIMVSATPRETPANANSVAKVTVTFSEVIESGLIKKDTIINADLENVTGETGSNVLLQAALQKQTELHALNPEIMPLILVQLPNENENMSDLDKTEKQAVENYLETKGITYENGKLAVWLSGEKHNLEHILDFDSQVQVLIFKQAIALGWDCPRAGIMVMFRENKSESFQIQTVGRIMRMPEARHYDNDRLNSAYIYSAIDQIVIGETDDSEKGYFNFNTMKITETAKAHNVTLPSVYLNRTDQHTLTHEHFYPILVENLCKAFELDGTEMVDAVKQKIDDKLEIYDDELKRDIIINEVIRDLERYDGTKSDVEKIRIDTSYEEIEYIYEQFVRRWCLPYGIEKSKAKIKNALSKVFSLGDFNETQFKKFIVCSRANFDFITKIIEKSKTEYEPERIKIDGDKRELTRIDWSLPENDTVNESYERKDYTKHALQPCYMKFDSNLEKEFAQFLNQSDKVIWFYKNGVKYGKYFGVLYTNSEGKESVFYPDWLIQTSAKLWILDTKDIHGSSGEDHQNPANTQAKLQALRQWIDTQENIDGGIVTKDGNVWKIYRYKNDENADFDVVAEPQAIYGLGKKEEFVV